MPHVVTQSCVGDGSCVYACPVNCIQPTPDDPAFELAEMLHVDPAACVDCGACVSACPVDAIKPYAALDSGERAFAAINAGYYRIPPARPPLAPVRPPLRVRRGARPLAVAIVGSGPAAMYAADEILTITDARVDVYERLPVPYGLVQTGIAPDHRRTRRIARQLDAIAADPRLRMHFGVEIGTDVTHDRLLDTHDAVIYAVGAAADRRLEIPGAELPGVASATQLVGWYNGHPDHADRCFDLAHRRAVVVGNGNVALDVARILTVDPETLADTDVAPAALAALRASQLEEVVVVGRRGPEEAAFTLPELVGLSATPGIVVAVPPAELAGTTAGDPRVGIMRTLLADGRPGRRITLRFGLSPRRVLGKAAVTGLQFDRETIDAGLVITSIGYRGMPVAGLPYDEVTGTIPNAEGRVLDPTTGAPLPGTYVVGWIKRGPTGFIGTNKSCSQDTVLSLVEDHNAGRLAKRRDDSPLLF
ncbi:MAG TPA: 4Fe-4S binding protein [Solirubrobacterales bacterium]|nr:4Fe-4S binding protein [Solirubrobacterales bacterium]